MQEIRRSAGMARTGQNGGRMSTTLRQKAVWLRQFLSVRPDMLRYIRLIRRSDHFDRGHYRQAGPPLHPLFQRFPERHYAIFGEREGRAPHPDFDAAAYLRANPDLADWPGAAYDHFLRYGRAEGRPLNAPPSAPPVRLSEPPRLPQPGERPASEPYAIVVHLYYPELWNEIATALDGLDIAFDLFVTLADRGPAADGRGCAQAGLAARIQRRFPRALVVTMPNRGRDILPFVHLVNSGLLDPYRAVAKVHGKRSPHRDDGDAWRRHLIGDILQGAQTGRLLNRFIADDRAGIWVADGQHYRAAQWWGSNHERTAWLLRRAQLRPGDAPQGFPAGSIYWLKPEVLRMIRGLRLDQTLFEPEAGQLDGTLAHAFERAVGALAAAADLGLRETADLRAGPGRRPRTAAAAPLSPAKRRAHPPRYVSAFYLPQFHRVAENDRWWGQGYTEWQAASRARPQFDGHDQPVLPGALGFYDLRQTDIMAEQAGLAHRAGVDAFCVYHYWFDGRRLLSAPLDGLMARRDIAFPFYLCWANESWWRNWDGLSGEVLVAQRYRPGFEEALALSTLPYMSDPRYQRPDGIRPRFVIYRPGELPEPRRNIERMRAAWRQLGIGEVELGAVRFHGAEGDSLAADLVDFWIEMPPHGLVEPEDYLFGGPAGNRLDLPVHPDFRGLVYDYARLAERATGPAYRATLAIDTIAGIMPSWDNTARRGPRAHIAYGAHPGSFGRWLDALAHHRLKRSYRGELFVNAWNEWGEKATLEPCRHYGMAWIDTLGQWRRNLERIEASEATKHAAPPYTATTEGADGSACPSYRHA